MAGRACKEAVATLGAPSHGPALPSAPRLVPFCPRARPLGATSPPDPWGPAQHPSPDGGWLSPPSPAALMLSTPRAPKEWGDPISPRTGQRLRSSAGPPSGPLAPGSACPWAARATVPEGSGGAQGTRRLSASLSGSAPSVWASRAWPSGDLGAVLGMRPEFRVPSPLLCPFPSQPEGVGCYGKLRAQVPGASGPAEGPRAAQDQRDALCPALLCTQTSGLRPPPTARLGLGLWVSPSGLPVSVYLSASVPLPPGPQEPRPSAGGTDRRQCPEVRVLGDSLPWGLCAQPTQACPSPMP